MYFYVFVSTYIIDTSILLYTYSAY